MTFVSRRAFLGALALCALLGLAHAERISISTQDGVETKREALRSRALQVSIVYIITCFNIEVVSRYVETILSKLGQ